MNGIAAVVAEISTANSVAGVKLNSLTAESLGTAGVQRALKQSAVMSSAALRSVTSVLNAAGVTSSPSSIVGSIVDTNRRLTSIAKGVTLTGSPVASAFAKQARAQAAASISGLSEPLKASLLQQNVTRSLSASLVAQERLGAIGRVPLGGLIASDESFRRSTAAHLGRVTRAYASVVDAAAHQSALLPRLPLIASCAPVDYYRHVGALDSISGACPSEVVVDDVDASLSEVRPGVDDLLRRLEPALCPLLQGARQALGDNNPDHVRHVTTSLRELFTQSLHRLAPDDDVRAWTSDAKFFHNGRPTRRARLLYVCREIDSDAFSSFVSADVNSALALFDSLSSGTHAVASRLTTKQLAATVRRMESLLVFLMRTAWDE